MDVITYAPRDKRELRRVFNNIYVKNFPASWSKEEVENYFKQYGHIKSLMLAKNENGSPFAFVCYEDPN